MTEAWRTNPVVGELSRRIHDTHVFFRMAALELRRIAEGIPEAAGELLNLAQKLEVEAEDLARLGAE